MVKTSKIKKPCDIYVLMVGKFPVYNYRGFATGQELLVEENLGDLGHGPSYLLGQTRLHPELPTGVVEVHKTCSICEHFVYKGALWWCRANKSQIISRLHTCVHFSDRYAKEN